MLAPLTLALSLSALAHGQQVPDVWTDDEASVVDPDDAFEAAAVDPVVEAAKVEEAPAKHRVHFADSEVCERPGSSLARRLPRRHDGLRRLKCHAFFRPSGIDDAFMTTSFASVTGAGVLFFPGYVDEEGDQYDLLLVGAALTARASVQFFNWVMLYGEGTGSVAIGGNLPSVIDPGAAATGAWDVGVGVKLFRVRKSGTQMSARIKFRGTDGVRVRPDSLVEIYERRSDGNITALGPDELATVLLNSSDLGGGVSLNLAQSFGSAFSIQASMEAAAGKWTDEAIDDSDPDDVSKFAFEGSYVTLQPGIALTLDGWPMVPLALQAEYGYGWTRNAFEDQRYEVSDHSVYGGLFYSGHPDIVIGLRAGGVVATSEPVAPLQVSGGLELQVYL